jgi:hypothetical protein
MRPRPQEDDEEPGVVPMIEPLRLLLDAVKPENTSGFFGLTPLMDQ